MLELVILDLALVAALVILPQGEREGRSYLQIRAAANEAAGLRRRDGS